MAVWLEHVETGQFFQLVQDRFLMIGRRPDANIVLHDLSISREHCKIHWDGCRAWVVVLMDRSDTTINSRFLHDYLQSTVLSLSDILGVGPMHFRLGTSSRIDPAWLTWNGGMIVPMAQKIYDSLPSVVGVYGSGKQIFSTTTKMSDSCDFTDMLILADALEEAGCTDQDILGHCRSGADHVRGCWVIDALLGKC